MCIAIAIPKGKANFLTEDIMENCYLVNPDGIGYVFFNSKNKPVHRLFMRFEKFLDQWKKDLPDIVDSACLLHFRATSRGETTVENCHPFKIGKRQFFIHNGTIHNMKIDPNRKKSDTNLFNDEVLRKLPIGWEKSEACKLLIEKFIGINSKVVVLNSDATFSFYNEAEGHWRDGIWWSNYHYTGKFYRGNTGAAKVQNTTAKTTPNTTRTSSNNNQQPKKDLLLGAPVKRSEAKPNSIEFSQCEFCTQSFSIHILKSMSFGYGPNEQYIICPDCMKECFEGLGVTE